MPVNRYPQTISLRYFIEVSYNGHAYHGWQVQQNANTVQQEINNAFELYFRHQIDTVGSGRTDAGVHAMQQFFHVDLPDLPDSREVCRKINGILPSDIALVNFHQVHQAAHARFDAISRSYRYRIHSLKNPFIQNFSYYFRPELDLATMNEACQYLVGEMDFKCFSRVKTSVENFICTITRAQWESHNEEYSFYVSANRFLRGMVRSMVGTLLDIGTGRSNIEQFRKIIESKDRKQAGRSVPSHGLFLINVEYPKDLITGS